MSAPFQYPTGRWWENNEGVHFVGPGAGHEFTLCGVANDCDESDGVDPMRTSDERVVTCPACVEVIKACRDLRFKP